MHNTHPYFSLRNLGKKVRIRHSKLRHRASEFSSERSWHNWSTGTAPALLLNQRRDTWTEADFNQGGHTDDTGQFQNTLSRACWVCPAFPLVASGPALNEDLTFPATCYLPRKGGGVENQVIYYNLHILFFFFTTYLSYTTYIFLLSYQDLDKKKLQNTG